MDSVVIGVGRGRGNATNLPERALIELVKLKPLLYDKNVKDYRKPGVSDAAWGEVAESLETTVSNCKKRWKSLRDTFIKYYRLEVLYQNGGARRKHKKWEFYLDLAFLKQHVELFRLEDGSKDGNESTSSYLKDSILDTSDGEKHGANIADDEIKEVYEIKITDEEYLDETTAYQLKEDDQIIESYEEQLDDNADHFHVIEGSLIEKGNHIDTEEDLESFETELVDQEELLDEMQETLDLRNKSKIDPHQKLRILSVQSNSSQTKNIVDPDERYLMSCLPAFKRFSPQQRAYVRMGIERLFYEVEFENISDPKNKRFRQN